MKRARGLVLLVLVTVLAAPWSGARAESDVRAGKRLAKAYCSQCHAIGRHGDSKHAAAPPFRTLSQRYPIDDLGPRFAAGISASHPDMPHWTLDPPEVRQMLAYLSSVQPKPPKGAVKAN